MSKVLRPGEIAEIVETILCNPEQLGRSWEDDNEHLEDFLEDLASLICQYFGGDVVSVSGPEYSRQDALEAGIVPDDCETEWCVHIQGSGSEAPQDHWTREYDRDGDLYPWGAENQWAMSKRFGYGLHSGEHTPPEIEPWTGDPEHRFVEDAQEEVWEAFWENLRREEATGGMHWFALRHLQEVNPLEVYYLREHCLKSGKEDIPQLAVWLEKHGIRPEKEA